VIEPPLVTEARALAERLGFAGSSIPEFGRLLAALAAARPGGRLAEAGTGTGVGSAWIVSALPPEATLVTVELDAARAAAARGLLASEPAVEVLACDWRELLPPRAPVDLLFLDGGHGKRQPDRLPLELLARAARSPRLPPPRC